MAEAYLPYPRQTRRRRRSDASPVSIEVGKRSAWLRGPGLSAVLDEVQVPRMWCPWQKCLTCPVDRLDDVLALLEHRDGRAVELLAVDR